MDSIAHCTNMYLQREDDPQQLKQARCIYTVDSTSVAHCANMYPQREYDPQQLKQARYTEYEKKLSKIHLSIATGKFKDIKKSI